MATVSILISDQPDGLLIKLTSDEPMPKDGEAEDSGAGRGGLRGRSCSKGARVVWGFFF